MLGARKRVNIQEGRPLLGHLLHDEGHHVEALADERLPHLVPARPVPPAEPIRKQHVGGIEGVGIILRMAQVARVDLVDVTDQLLRSSRERSGR